MPRRKMKNRAGVSKIVAKPIDMETLQELLLNRKPLTLPQPLEFRRWQFLIVAQADAKPTIASRMVPGMADFLERLQPLIIQLGQRLLDGIYLSDYCIIRMQDAEELEVTHD